MWNRISAALLLLCLVTMNEALRILVCFPMTSKSHSILGHGFVDRLLEAGHEVVHITSFPKLKPVPKYKEIHVSSLVNFQKELDKEEAFTVRNIITNGGFGSSVLMYYFTYSVHKLLIQEPGVQKLLNDSNEKFDAVILEWFVSQITVGIPALFEAPLIWSYSSEPDGHILRLLDGLPNPAYNIDMFSTVIPPLDFWQRAGQLWELSKKYVIFHLFVMPLENWFYNSVYTKIAEKRGVTLPPYREAMYNASLMFVNSHPSIGGALTLPQSAINIGGYHIPEKVKPLHEHLQTVMDAAKHGVVYFSLGSHMKSEGMSEGMKRSLLNMFSKLDQTVIWKFESSLDNVPSNVYLVKWAPQQSILAHPNLKVFVTHGGRLSTTEATHFGVPLVGIPIFGDQHINMAVVEKKGFGTKVKLAEDMTDDLEKAIRKVLKNDTYKMNAIKCSEIYHDRPMKPGDAVSYWVEHVVKTRGAPHLRSPALSLCLFQRLYLDLLTVIVVVVVLIYKLIKYVLKMRSKCTSNKSKKKKKD